MLDVHHSIQMFFNQIVEKYCPFLAKLFVRNHHISHPCVSRISKRWCFRPSYISVPCKCCYHVFGETPASCTDIGMYIHILFFSASAFALGSPTGGGADLTWCCKVLASVFRGKVASPLIGVRRPCAFCGDNLELRIVKQTRHQQK